MKKIKIKIELQQAGGCLRVELSPLACALLSSICQENEKKNIGQENEKKNICQENEKK